MGTKQKGSFLVNTFKLPALSASCSWCRKTSLMGNFLLTSAFTFHLFCASVHREVWRSLTSPSFARWSSCSSHSCHKAGISDVPSLPTASLSVKEDKLQKHLPVCISLTLSDGQSTVPCDRWHHTRDEGVGQARGTSGGATASQL